MTKATTDLMAQLHGALADKMAEILKGENVTASDLSVIRQFLKDNGINSDPETDAKVRKLSDDLPQDLGDNVIAYGS